MNVFYWSILLFLYISIILLNIRIISVCHKSSTGIFPDVCNTAGQKLKWLTARRSWWTSWGAELVCWARDRAAPQTSPTAEPHYSAAAGTPAPPCVHCSPDDWTCRRSALAAHTHRGETLRWVWCLNKFILLSYRDALKWSKVTVKTFIMLQRFYFK